jgi:putative DNA primase/helicase
MVRPTTKRTLTIEGQMAEENTASSGASAKSEALELFSGPADALPKAKRLLELIADDDFEGALAHNASVAKEMPAAAAVEDWFLNRFEEWDEPALVKAKEDWAKAKAAKAARSAVIRRFLKPPKPQENASGDSGPSIEAALKVSGKADFASRLEEAIKRTAGPETEARAKPAREGRFQLDEEETTPVLSKAAPMDSARAFARDRLRKGGVLATYYYHGDWWQWNGRFYEIAPADRIAGAVYDYLDRALVRTANGEERFKPKPEHADALIKCLKACIAIDDRDGPPRWLNDREGPLAETLLVFQNCLVDVETGEVVELTPHLWVHGGVDFKFDANARCPRWERFLKEVFPGDPESQMTIEEQLGYGMTNDTRFEKGALWIGVKRSGKSTLAWVQERLAGVGVCVSLSFHDWMKTENSREHLIGRKVGVFADVRLKPAKVYGLTGYDPGGLDHQSAQMLLNIIGRDKVSLGRKFKRAWEGRLFLKVIITSNEVPNLQDAGGVLASRFIMLDFAQSFFGREDITLRTQLERELPGIANRCLAAYRRLCERGRFVQPACGQALVQNIEEKVSPFAAFMNQCVVEDTKGSVPAWSLYKTFLQWCGENRRNELTNSVTGANQLIREVNKIERWRWLKSAKPHADKRIYAGIKLREPEGT